MRGSDFEVQADGMRRRHEQARHCHPPSRQLVGLHLGRHHIMASTSTTTGFSSPLRHDRPRQALSIISPDLP